MKKLLEEALLLLDRLITTRNYFEMTHCRLASMEEKHRGASNKHKHNTLPTPPDDYALFKVGFKQQPAISSIRKGRHEVGQTEIKMRIADAFCFSMSSKQQALNKTAFFFLLVLQKPLKFYESIQTIKCNCNKAC